jgi:hypothetical protein
MEWIEGKAIPQWSKTEKSLANLLQPRSLKLVAQEKGMNRLNPQRTISLPAVRRHGSCSHTNNDTGFKEIISQQIGTHSPKRANEREGLRKRLISNTAHLSHPWLQ